MPPLCFLWSIIRVEKVEEYLKGDSINVPLTLIGLKAVSSRCVKVWALNKMRKAFLTENPVSSGRKTGDIFLTGNIYFLSLEEK
jgi:hypothetical protein